MGEHCVTCGQNSLTPKTSIALKEGFRHKTCPPPTVEFFPERICAKHKRVAPTCPDCRSRHYRIDGEKTVNGREIVSVTTVTREIGDTFGQGAWWGQGVGVAGYDALLRKGIIGGEEIEPADVVPLLTGHKLTTNHTRDEAAGRGTSVHRLGETWAKTGTLPESEEHPGYREALRRFIETERPEPLGAEVLVGSRKFAYAGTFDLLAHFPKMDATGVVDLKTKTKPPKGQPKAYDQHHLQIRGYEDARVEMGMEPSDLQCVVNLYPDGTYALVQGRATSAQWQDALAAYRSLIQLQRSIKAAA